MVRLIPLLLIGSLMAPAAAVAQRSIVRNRELGRQDSGRIVQLLGVRPGESVAAIGAGSSFLLQELSVAVGSRGKVYVVDWDRTAVQGVQHRIEQDRLGNVSVILGSPNDALLPKHADKLLFVNSYRLIEDRRRFLENNRKYLSSDARIAVIDYYRRLMPVGPPLKERIASHRVHQDMQRLGYVLADRHNISSLQYFLVYRPRRRS